MSESSPTIPALRLIPIDLSKAEQHKHPDLNETDDFLCLIDGEFHVGRFSRQWYGWNFDGWKWNIAAGLQFDEPGTNYSKWEAVWRIQSQQKGKKK